MDIKKYSELTEKSMPSIRKQLAKGKIVGARKINGKWDIPIPSEQTAPVAKVATISKVNNEMEYETLKDQKLHEEIQKLKKQQIELDQKNQLKKDKFFEEVLELISSEFKTTLGKIGIEITSLKLEKDVIDKLNGAIDKCINESIPSLSKKLSKKHSEF